MGIQFGGLASGLDTNAIIQALVAVQARPIQLLGVQRGENQSKLTQIGVIEGLVKTLEDKAQGLTNLGGFFSYGVNPADETFADFSVTGTVTPGNHSINVTQLASAARYGLEPATTVTDPDDGSFGAGDISFTYNGTAHTITIADGSSLNDIASEITSVAGADVTTSVINVGTSNSPDYQLVIAGNDTGADFDLVGLTADAGIGLNVNATALTEALNAQVTVDGLDIERSTNIFDDVLPGISFTAQAVGSTTFTTDIDTEGTKENLQEFVDAYNAVVNYINDQSTYSEEEGAGGVLFGDRILRSVTSTLNSALFNPDLDTVKNDTEGYSTLGLVGIDLNDDGTLTIDSEDLEGKLTGNPELFEAFFTDDDTGVITKLNEALDGLLDGPTNSAGETLDSLFTGRRKALDTIIDSIDDQIERLESNLERFEESLVQRFANLESVIGGLNSQSAFLAQNLAATNS